MRFSDRVDDYVRYRPGYPIEIFDFLKSELGLRPSDTIADIGSGTGISSRFFLQNGNKVCGVEPNEEMRKAAEIEFRSFSNFTSVAGTAENTTLPAAVVDFIIAAQAFHWFVPDPTREEFRRILRPSGWVLLIWNKRRISETKFLEEYEKLILEFGTDYRRVRHPDVDKSKEISRFFGAEGFKVKSFYNSQEFDFEGLCGRLTSSSYAPNRDHPKHGAMIKALRSLFDRHQSAGRVKMEYDTNLFYGALR